MHDIPENPGGGGPSSPYPRLDVRLQRLAGPLLQFWGDPAAREQALRAILDAYRDGDRQRLDAALHAVDDAIVGGMRALGFNRGPINAIYVRRLGLLGQKRSTCELEVDILQIRRALTVTHLPDGIVETWIHESAHARRAPWASDFMSEQIQWQGYEEGLAEGLTGAIARIAAFTPGVRVYVRYRRGYELLAEVLGVAPEELYRRLWPHEPGSVRRAFTDVVNDLYHVSRGRVLSLQERWDLQDQGDTIFDTALETVFNRATERAMRNAWQGRLP